MEEISGVYNNQPLYRLEPSIKRLYIEFRPSTALVDDFPHQPLPNFTLTGTSSVKEIILRITLCYSTLSHTAFFIEIIHSFRQMSALLHISHSPS